ncbi:MAG: RagB/SusD family nutrient uptake outer membrane protein [Muribaculaceae bacterium]|nr:RagB/SusD family nutrient uptake outer membrane protein [Muribaculaceae bacterium]
MRKKVMAWKTAKRVVMAAVATMALAGMTACGFDDEDEPEPTPDDDNEIVDGEQPGTDGDVTVSTHEVMFGYEGGTESVAIRTDIELFLEKPANGTDTDADSTLNVVPDIGVTEDYLSNDFYADNGREMRFRAELADTALVISVDRAMSRIPKTETLTLYNSGGRAEVLVKIIQEGNPHIDAELSQTGRALVNSAMGMTCDMLLSMRRFESGYVKDPSTRLTAGDSDISRLYSDCCRTTNSVYSLGEALNEAGMREAAMFFDLIAAIGNVETVDKWHNVAMPGRWGSDIMNPKQLAADTILLAQRDKLTEMMIHCETDGWDGGYAVSEEMALMVPRPAIMCAIADVAMLLKDYNYAENMLEQTTKMGRWVLNSGAFDDFYNTDVIFGLGIGLGAEKRMPVYTLSDVYLSLAECKAVKGDMGMAADLINQVRRAKGLYTIYPDADMMAIIAETRQDLGLPRQLAFMRRHGLGGFESWQYYWPIPETELAKLSGWTQNAGYMSR